MDAACRRSCSIPDKATMTRFAVGALLLIVLLAAGFIVACNAPIADFPVRMMPFFAGMLLAEGVGNRVPAWLGWAAPAVAFAIGLIVLSQIIHPWDLVGMVCVVIAGAGVTYDAATSKPTLVQ